MSSIVFLILYFQSKHFNGLNRSIFMFEAPGCCSSESELEEQNKRSHNAATRKDIFSGGCCCSCCCFCCFTGPNKAGGPSLTSQIVSGYARSKKDMTCVTTMSLRCFSQRAVSHTLAHALSQLCHCHFSSEQ